MSRPLKHLLLTTTEDPYNPRSWSGTPFALRTALERQVEKVTVFRPPPPKRAPLDALRRILFGAVKYPLWITYATLKQNARSVSAYIDKVRPDAVLSISSPCVAYLTDPGVPTYLFSDAPYLAFCETYSEWETPPLRIGVFAREEAAAGRRLDGLCFGSAWACGEARRLYKLGPEASARLHVTPLGANRVPVESREAILTHVQARDLHEVRLLFIGRDWERKGGPLAVEVARLLAAAGQPVRLHIVGCRPELDPALTGPGGVVTVHGPLDPADAVAGAQLNALFLDSHFLIVPTRAECFGVVFAEAQAFALPPIARAVHAVPSVVEDGVTGLLFDVHAPASAYVERLLPLVKDPEAYRRMARAARERFERTLTWDRTAERIVAAITAGLA